MISLNQNIMVSNKNMESYKNSRAKDTEQKNFEQVFESTKLYSSNTDTEKDLKPSEKYDIRNATFKEMCEIAHELYDEGKIDLGTLAKMTLDKSKIIENLNSHYRRINSSNRVVIEGNPMFEGYNGKRYDWIDLTTRKSDQQSKLGNTDSRGYDKLISAFEEL